MKTTPEYWAEKIGIELYDAKLLNSVQLMKAEKIMEPLIKEMLSHENNNVVR